MRFTLPRDLYHGKDTLEAPKILAGEKTIVVVGGGSMKRFGFLDKVVDYLKEAGMEVQLFRDVKPDPSVDAVLKDATTMQEFEPDWIVTVGSGFPVDAAKATWTFYEYPDTSFEDLTTPFSFPTSRAKVKFRVISSISGTATGVIAFSVTIDYKKGTKYPLTDFNITPDVAIVDPALTETIPKKLTAHTGMDAMTYVIKAYVSTPRCEYTDPLALHVVEMINEYLISSYNGNMEARDKIHDAQCLAGMAFPNVLFGVVHSMAHKTGAAYSGGHVVHDCANAMYPPRAIRFNPKEPKVTARYAKIAKFINLPGITDEELTDTLVVRLLEMSKTLDIPACIKDYEDGIIDEKESMDKLPEVTEPVVGDTCAGSSPRTITPEAMEQLLKCCYYDEEVDS